PWPGETGGERNAVRFAAGIDRLQLFRNLRHILLRQPQMVPRVVANLKAVFMKLGDFLPGHVVLLVVLEVEAFGDKKRRAELVLQQHRPGDGEVGLRSIVERQDHEFVWQRLKGEGNLAKKWQQIDEEERRGAV